MRYLKDFVLLAGHRYGFIDKRNRLYNNEVVLSSIKDKTLYGEFVDDQVGNHLDRITHSIENIREVDGKLLGDVTILDTPIGMVVQQLLDNGVIFTTSMACIGFLREITTLPDFYAVIEFDLRTFNIIKEDK